MPVHENIFLQTNVLVMQTLQIIFIFNKKLYKQVDGATLGNSLGPACP